ncbi:MAG: two-component system, NtrC family, C4-dicarboxylate transport sensor histidine kinase DctB [Hyphomicrobiales bacterium]|jgi:two-component system C4-dicarboxylate transport sensor histidine kinase DctB|nr:two-component system, NtrC family, C4-dicarboxylate transport sensor histidine kinase DctB [Hyphomicrobiales bacterium]
MPSTVPGRQIRSALFVAGALATVAVSALALAYLWRETGLRSLQAVNEPRIELIASAVRSEINRQDHLPVLLSLDDNVRDALKTPQNQSRLAQLSDKLQRIITEADTRALYVIGANGTVLAAGSANPAETLVGRNLIDRSYFVKALESGRSSYLGVEPVNSRVRYYLTEAIRDTAMLGVAVVRIEFDSLESAWERSGERVLITDPDGVVFLTSDPAYKYQTIGGISAPHLATESAPPNYPENLIKPLDLTVLNRRGTNAIVRLKTGNEDAHYLYQTMQLPEFGWTIHRFADLAIVEADERDGAIIGGAISALIISLLLYLVQRQRAYLDAREAGAKLQNEVAARTRELREANILLQSEVDERRRTEARLRTTQNELVQAGKLAALGQMSAAIAHEVNQPLAAIRTFMASAKVFLQRGDSRQVIKNLDLIDGLAERMAAITNHLKAFARKSEPGRPEPVSVARAVEGALFLIESQIKAANVHITRDVQPDLWVSGYAVQLEQVLVNLIRNALDAVTEVKRPAVEIAVRASEDIVRIVIADNGPGVPSELIERIFDPFVTSKPVGKGLGLGLSISYGIVQDFRGSIHASNRPEGGAELTIELPRLMPGNVPLEKALHV